MLVYTLPTLEVLRDEVRRWEGIHLPNHGNSIKIHWAGLGFSIT